MNKTELLKLKEQLEKEYAEVKESFAKDCKDNFPFGTSEEKDELISVLLDGEEYDELDAEIDNEFYFPNGNARRKFDIYREKGGMLNQLILRINEILGEESDDDYWWDEYTWGKEGLEQKIEESKKAIAEENAFIEFAEKGLKILEELPEEE